MVNRVPAVSGDDVDQAIVRALDFTLSGADFKWSGLSWTWRSNSAFVACTAMRAAGGDGLAYSIRIGWRYEAFDDPVADPETAHGCVRSMTLDELGILAGTPIGAVGHPERASVDDFEKRLTMFARKHLVRWVDIWKRAEGFRDFLAYQNYHLAAAWASALLRHHDRARLELAHAAHLYLQPLDEAFDRRRADVDGSMAGVFASTNGLADLLGLTDPDTLAAFTSVRGATARTKVLEPHSEHQRLQRRHEAYATACLRYLDS